MKNNEKEEVLEEQTSEEIADLSEENVESKEVKVSEKKKVKRKGILIAVASIASIFLILVIVFGVSAIKRNQIIKQADSLVSMEKFEDGIAMYDSILSEKYSPAIIVKKDRAIKLMESYEKFEKGIEAFDDDEKEKAIKNLSKVDKEDKKRYKEAMEKLKEIEEVVVMEIEELINSEKLEEASKEIGKYIKLLPDSVDLQNAKEAIVAKNIDIENEVKAEEQAQKDQEAAEAKAAKNEAANRRKKEEAMMIADNLRYTTKSIITTEANLRDAPTLKGNIIDVLPRGTDVYINDTQIETADRIWCQVDYGYGYGWISYNTMNYSMP